MSIEDSPNNRAPNFQDSIKRQIGNLDTADEKDALDFIDRVAEEPED